MDILTLCPFTGTPTIIPSSCVMNTTVESSSEVSTSKKGKSVASITPFDLSDQDTEDEYGYTDRISGISKGASHIQY